MGLGTSVGVSMVGVALGVAVIVGSGVSVGTCTGVSVGTGAVGVSGGAGGGVLVAPGPFEVSSAVEVAEGLALFFSGLVSLVGFGVSVASASCCFLTGEGGASYVAVAGACGGRAGVAEGVTVAVAPSS